MSLDQIKNRGHWKVAGKEFNNKVNAILHAQQLDLGVSDITYHFNDLWWDRYDWSTEPEQSLDDLYIHRARQLREKYKTLILRFSGGSDSYNILKTFVENDIKLDIVSVNLWKLGDPDNIVVPNNIEKEKLAFPLLHELKKQGADFKIIISDQTDLFSIIGNDIKWFLKIDAPRFTLIDIIAHRTCTTKEYREFDKSTTCVISGIDKPQIKIKHDKIWYFEIADFLHTMINPSELQMIQEPFYWSADMPEIPIKQSHVVKNFYKKNKNLLLSEARDTSIKYMHFNKTRLIPIIYPKWFGHLDPSQDALPYYDMSADAVEWKKQNNLGDLAPRGMGTDRNMHLSPYFSTWQKGIDLADSMIDRKFKNSESIMQGGLIPRYSKKRWIGK